MQSKPVQNLSRGFGWAVLCVWVASLTFYGLWEVATAPDEPLTDKLLVFGFFLGVALLFLSVLIERIREGRTDKYKGVHK